MPKPLREHAEFACDRLQRMALEISGTMSRFQLKLADRQCRMAELSQRCQDLITMLTTSMYGARHDEPIGAATRPTSSARTCGRSCSAGGRRITTSAASPSSARRSPTANSARIAGVEADEILMPYAGVACVGERAEQAPPLNVY